MISAFLKHVAACRYLILLGTMINAKLLFVAVNQKSLIEHDQLGP